MKFEENLNSLANDFAKVLQTEHAQIEQLTEILTKLNEKIEAKDLEQSSGFDVDNHFRSI